ncbi:MAG: bifunctional riboflavin kinase/FMN adenylyltransferase [Sedimentisphaerales bacterium]|nr:bifunctional riboflavin kinase/FMN adenylyltransferase [Sedimentisphaerales bacterium]
MQVIETKEQYEHIAKGQVLTIGNFDGVHIGHQELLRRARAIAKKHNTSVAAMTFWPHPAAVLHPEKAPQLLTPLPLKKRLLEENGVDCLIVVSDTYSLLNLSPKDFVDEFLMKTVRPCAVVEGVNFTFGYGRSGNVLLLRDMGKERRFEVIIVEPKESAFSKGEHGTVSSSLIRGFLEKGNVKDAAAALGRPYKLIGKTIPGRGKGSEIGFPTANIEPLEQMIPAEGVYAGFVEVGESVEDVCVSKKRLPVAISIGRAKTFLSEHPLLLEAHILATEKNKLDTDFTDYTDLKSKIQNLKSKIVSATENTEVTERNNKVNTNKNNVPNLYGKWLAMDFIARIRPQHRFENVDALKAQIAKDCEQIKRILATEDTEDTVENRR